MQQIYKYTISLLLGFCLLTVVNAQNKITVDSVTKKTPIVIKKVPVINWFRVDLDISPIITTLLAKGETYSFEGAVQTSLKNKYFPVAEIGFAGANKTSIDNIDFSTKGMFCRIGTDINVMKQKDKSKKTNNQFLLGVRLGFSHFS